MRSLFFIRRLFLVAITIGMLAPLLAQSPGAVYLHDYKVDFQEHGHVSLQEHTAVDVKGGRSLSVVQFKAPLTRAQLADYAQHGWYFEYYLSHFAYIVSYPLASKLSTELSALIYGSATFAAEWKLAPALFQPSANWAKDGKNRRKVYLRYRHDVTAQQAEEWAHDAGIEIVHHQPTLHNIEASIPEDKVLTIASQSWILSMEQVSEPGQPEDLNARAIHRANHLHQAFDGGRKYDGSGIGVLVRDDGLLEEHIDFKGREVDLAQGFRVGTHGDQVAGVIGGAGNISPLIRGMATGATIYNTDYFSAFSDYTTLTLNRDSAVYITNSSYSNGCNAGYTTETENVDRQIIENPNLIHVFSAGNSGSQNCGYGAGNRWGNITGGHKIGKNVIATANLNATGVVVSSSSRGPAYDGRLKPDIAAHGQGQVTAYPVNSYDAFGGTSAASPGIAGVFAQLYHAYRDLHAGAYPASALMKAILLNNARDAGAPGPDFVYGWGIVNGKGAIETLEQNRFLHDTLLQSQQKSFTLSVPNGAVHGKIMLYWPDQPSFRGSRRHLVSNLDLYAISPSGDTLYPLILDHTREADSLIKPAVPGIDSINNMEQIVVHLPESGDYEFVVSGTEVPFGEASFYLTWTWMGDRIDLTYPNGGEQLPVNTQIPITWDLSPLASSSDILLMRSLDNGTSWDTLRTLPSNASMTYINTNFVNSNQVLMRIEQGNNSDQIEHPYTVSEVPMQVRISKVCVDSFTLTWDTLEEAGAYVVYALGDRYMDSLFSVIAPPISLAKSDFPSKDTWLAIGMQHNEGWQGIRSNAINIMYDTELVNCNLKHDLSAVRTGLSIGTSRFSCKPARHPVFVDIHNNGTKPSYDFDIYVIINSGDTIVYSYTDTLQSDDSIRFVTPDSFFLYPNVSNNIIAGIIASNDGYNANDTSMAFPFYHLVSDPIVIDEQQRTWIEDFEGTLFTIPSLWELDNPDQSLTWTVSNNIININDTFSNVISMNNFSYSNGVGQHDILYSPPIYLDSTHLPYSLYFDLAYAYYNQFYSDSLLVSISSTCESAFTDTLLYAFGAELATVGSRDTMFVPKKASEWKAYEFLLNRYLGDTIIVKFEAICGFGNNLFLDNIGISQEMVSTKQIEALSSHLQLLPNPAQDFCELTWENDREVQAKRVSIFNAHGQQVDTYALNSFEQRKGRLSLSVAHLPPGFYTVKLVLDDGSHGIRKFVISR